MHGRTIIIILIAILIASLAYIAFKPKQIIAPENLNNQTQSTTESNKSNVGNQTQTSIKSQTSVTSKQTVQLFSLNPTSGSDAIYPITAIGSGFDAKNNKVYFGGVRVINTYSSGDNGTVLTFNIPTSSVIPTCAYNGEMCPYASEPWKPGTYMVYIETSLGKSNSLPFIID